MRKGKCLRLASYSLLVLIWNPTPRTLDIAIDIQVELTRAQAALSEARELLNHYMHCGYMSGPDVTLWLRSHPEPNKET